MFDFQNDATDDVYLQQVDFGQTVPFSPPDIGLPKRIFDYALALCLLVPLVAFAALLLILNPFMNAGPLMFCQQRMGHHCKPFTALKFRSMLPADPAARGAFDALETDRITALGRLIRRSRIDELPQILNVLRGEMSLIGPRPDSYDHACVYLREIPGYAARHQVMPGISGFAQTEVGYVDGLEGVKRKVAADNYYIANASFWFDLWITWRTVYVVLARRGA
ncbi:sugar transferase [Yoonia sp. BS5-3]|uniref:Sugar transferase n=1 Tax=Yoonia phaeophyticola TaxID=3137369 RepID=A0ABZ2V468_9RHOB